MDKEYSDHIVEAKRRAICCIVVLAAFVMICCTKVTWIFDNVLKLCRDAGFEVISISPGDSVISVIALIFTMAVLLTAPFFVFQIMEFILPAVRRKDVLHIRLAAFMAMGLFYVGLAFSFFVMLPFFFEFMAEYGDKLHVSRSFSVSDYLSFICTFSVCLGLAFETPLIVIVLWCIRVIDSFTIKRIRGVLYLLIFVVAALITPPDAISQLMVALPMMFLFEAGNVCGKKLVSLKKRKVME